MRQSVSDLLPSRAGIRTAWPTTYCAPLSVSCVFVLVSNFLLKIQELLYYLPVPTLSFYLFQFTAMKLSQHLLQVEQAYQAMMASAMTLDLDRSMFHASYFARPRRDLPRHQPHASVPIIPDQHPPQSPASPHRNKEQLLLLAAFEATHHRSKTPISPDMVPLVIDTGASVSISPCLTDFIAPPPPCPTGLNPRHRIRPIGTRRRHHFIYLPQRCWHSSNPTSRWRFIRSPVYYAFDLSSSVRPCIG